MSASQEGAARILVPAAQRPELRGVFGGQVSCVILLS